MIDGIDNPGRARVFFSYYFFGCFIVFSFVVFCFVLLFSDATLDHIRVARGSVSANQADETVDHIRVAGHLQSVKNHLTIKYSSV